MSLFLVLMAVPLSAAERGGFELAVSVDHEELREYDARGSVYVEAQRGQSYELRLSNPTGDRVAVALSVDGLNTIDAQRHTAEHSPKWVIEPYGSVVISGWQVSDRDARQFFFTGAKRSYAAALGQTENLGVIEAVFFRERRSEPVPVYRGWEEDSRDGAARAPAAPPAAAAPSERGNTAQSKAEGKLSDDYAATGMGRRHEHEVERVSLDLDPSPVSTIRIRYEFHPALVKLGILPRTVSPLQRREAASGFASWCPEVE